MRERRIIGIAALTILMLLATTGAALALGSFAFVGGGENNTAEGDWATVGAGRDNAANGNFSSITGGRDNLAGGTDATVGGGRGNKANGKESAVGGGRANRASSLSSAVGGGKGNVASAKFATVPGGRDNKADGQYSLAAGRQAKANHDGTFVWADSDNADFESTGTDQFIIKAAGGVGINTNTPSEALDVWGNVNIPQSTATDGVIKSNGERFIHNFGVGNFFGGVDAGNLAMAGRSNTGIGVNALSNNARADATPPSAQRHLLRTLWAEATPRLGMTHSRAT